MTIAFDEPIWLLAAIAGALLAGVAWLRVAGMTRARRASTVIARLVFFGLLASLLAGASDVTRSEKLAVVAVVDVSGSARRFASLPGDSGDGDVLQQLRGAIEQMAQSRGADDLLGIVAFDGAAVAVATPSTADTAGRSIDVRLREGSDIASAMELAAGLIPGDAAGRILLISDGNETRGDALETARRLAARPGAPIRVDVSPLSYAVGSETIVESVDAPPRAPSGSIVTVRVVLNSTRGTSGVIRLYRQGEPIDAVGDPVGAGRRLSIGSGRHAELFEVPLPDARLHRFEAVYTPDESSAGSYVGDDFLDNNRGESFSISPGSGSILLIDGVSGGDPAGPGSTLAASLRQSGSEVRVVSPGGVPTDVLGLQPYDLVILQSAAADEVPEAAHEALARHVTDLGAGLIMVGGRGSFGAGAWKGTPIEPLLPVRLDLPEKLVVPETAIVLVLDSSGSMGGRVGGSTRSQQDIANAAAVAAIESLDRRDLVGVVEFDSNARWVVEFAPNDQPGRSAERVRGISPSGGTNLPPGLSLAADALRGSDAKVKHIIVLSDGVSSDAQTLPDLAASISNDGIHISTIAVGDGADTGTLASVARAGDGSFYRVADPNTLPRVFVRAVRVVRSPMIREAPFDPVITNPASPAITGLNSFPALQGIVLTQYRDDARVTNALSTPTGEPLLSHWTVELGRVAAFTSDAWLWADGWLDWDGYSRMWSQLVRSMSRTGDSSGSSFRAERTTDGLRLVYTAVDDRGAPVDLLRVPVSVYDPNNEASEVVLEQVGPGEYAAQVEAPQTGTYIAVAMPTLGARRLPSVITGASNSSGVEYERLSSNVSLLDQIASATGGRVIDLAMPSQADLWNRTGIEPRIAETPIWQRLLLITVLVLLLDVGTRRVAWDRIIGERSVRLDASERAAETLAKLKQKADRGRKTERTRVSAPESQAKSVQRPSVRTAPAAAEAPKVIDKTESPAHEDEPAGGLLAAKRRASKRFEEDS